MGVKVSNDISSERIHQICSPKFMYCGTWELGTPKGLPKTVLNYKVGLFIRFISMF